MCVPNKREGGRERGENREERKPDEQTEKQRGETKPGQHLKKFKIKKPEGFLRKRCKRSVRGSRPSEKVNTTRYQDVPKAAGPKKGKQRQSGLRNLYTGSRRQECTGKKKH